MTEILWPFGAGDSQALTATGAQAITITDNFTVIDGVTTQATGNRTINLTIGSSVKPGARLLVKLKSAATQTTTFGTGITDVVLTGVSGKTFTGGYTYDGTAFYPDGTIQQID
jgi:hypothetical protein